MNNSVYQDIESGYFDEELGKMVRDPENVDLTASQIKDKLVLKTLDNMVKWTDVGPILEQIGAYGFVLFIFILSFEFLVTPR